jgi:hypothetical protein
LALWLGLGFGKEGGGESGCVRLWVDLIEEASSVVFGEDAWVV